MSSFFDCPGFPAGEWNVAVPASIAFVIPQRPLVRGNAPYYDFMRELHRIGGNLNQIAQKAHVLGVIDERRYDEEMRKFDQLVRDITKAVILPRAME